MSDRPGKPGKSHRRRNAGRRKMTRHNVEPEMSELYANQEFEERLVPEAFDDWTNGAFVGDVDLIPDDHVLPCEKTLSVTEGGFLRITDSEGNHETIDPYLPENAWVLRELLGEPSDSDGEEDE